MSKSKTIQEQIEIMTHFANGGMVEIYKDGLWSDITNLDFRGWNFASYDFRKKEEKKTITIERWLCKDGNDSYYVVECNHIEGYEKVKLLDSYEVEL